MKLDQLRALRRLLVETKRLYFCKIWGMDIDPTCDFSLSARFDKTNPKGVHVGADTYVAFDAAILSHDLTRGKSVDTWIGKRCFIGARSIILPGITIGDECIVGSGSVVTKDVPPRCIVGGNPAKVIRTDIVVGRFGRLLPTPEAKAAAAPAKRRTSSRAAKRTAA
jgi:acetyltransferase-like isoleucine patch superfamily enzyme